VDLLFRYTDNDHTLEDLRIKGESVGFCRRPLKNNGEFRKIEVKALGKPDGKIREFSVRVRKGFRASY
jgi:hypothetical protein